MISDDAEGVRLVGKFVTETFEPGAETGGSDAGGRGLRYVEWRWIPESAQESYVTDMAYVLRDERGNVSVVHDRHTMGLFSRAAWLELIAHTIDISQPPDAVFWWLDEPTGAASWMSSAVTTEIPHGTPDLVGTKFCAIVADDRRSTALLGAVTTYLPNQRKVLTRLQRERAELRRLGESRAKLADRCAYPGGILQCTRRSTREVAK